MMRALLALNSFTSKAGQSIVILFFASLISIGLWCIHSPVANAALFSFAGDRPNNLGINSKGQFAPCAPTPNCVNSQASDVQHQIAPIAAHGDVAQVWANLKHILASQANARIVSETENYLYTEFTSKLMGFVDDVEFYLTQDDIQVRSASRLGESDLGVNRQRIEAIRSQLH